MKKFYLTFVVLICIFGIVNLPEANATHASGGEISYQDLGNDSFLVKMVLYRSCLGINYNSSYNIDITSVNDTFQLRVDRDSITDISPVCASQCTRCAGSCNFGYGIENYTYSGILYLPDSVACEYTFSLKPNIEARSNNDVLQTNTTYYMYLTSFLNKCFKSNTLEFKFDAVNIVCRGLDQLLQFYVNEAYGDEIRYSMTSPLTTNGQNIPYLSGYSYTAPFDYLGKGTVGINGPLPFGILLDSLNGNLAFRPTTVQNSFFAVKAQKFRNDTLIGEITRDIYLQVINCNTSGRSPAIYRPEEEDTFCLSQAPGSSRPLCTRTFELNLCANENFTFKVNTSILEPNTTNVNYADSVYVDLILNTVPGANFYTHDAYLKSSGIFNWTPDSSHINNGPYTAIFKASDNLCPVNTFSNRIYSINVLAERPQAGFSYTIYDCGRVDFVGNRADTNEVIWLWEGEDGLKSKDSAFTHYYSTPGTWVYSITISSHGCVNTFYDTIQIPEFLQVDIGNDISICVGDSFMIHPDIQYSVGNYTFDWTTNDTTLTIRDIGTNVLNYNIRTVNYTITVEDSLCTQEETVFLRVSYQPNPNVKNNMVLCVDDTITISTKSAYNNFDHQLYFIDEDTIIPGPGNKFNIVKEGTYVFQVTGSTNLNCQSIDTIVVKQHPGVTASASISQSEICRNETIILSAGGGDIYEWYDTSSAQLISQDQQLFLTPQNTTTYVVYAFVLLDDTYCYDSAFVNVKVNPVPPADYSTFPYLHCESDGKVFFPDPGIYTDSWTGNGVSDSLGHYYFDTKIAKKGEHYFVYTLSNPNTLCETTDSIKVEILEFSDHDFPGFPLVYCVNEGNIELAEAGPLNIIWSGTGVSFSQGKFRFNTLIAEDGLHTLYYTISHPQIGCDHSDSILIEVLALPEIDLSSLSSTYCIEHGKIDLPKSDVLNTEWTGIGITGSQNDYSFDPEIAGSGMHTLTYKIYYTQPNCFLSKNIIIEVVDLSKIVFNPEFDVFCIDHGIIELPDIANYSVEWSGISVTQGQGQYYFDTRIAETGTHIINYIIKDTQLNCVYNNEAIIEVVNKPDLDFKVTPEYGNPPLAILLEGFTSSVVKNWKWKVFNDNDTVTQSGQKVNTVVREIGIYKIKVSAEHFLAENCDNAYIKNDALFLYPVSVFENPLISSIQLYPNPVNKILIIENSGPYVIEKIILKSMNGKIINTYMHPVNQIDLTINDTELSSGTYLVSIYLTNGGLLNRNIVVK